MNTEASFKLNSLTAVLKAKKLLSSRGFGVTSSKTTSKDSQGCSYLITITSGSPSAAKKLLRENGISTV